MQQETTDLLFCLLIKYRRRRFQATTQQFNSKWTWHKNRKRLSGSKKFCQYYTLHTAFLFAMGSYVMNTIYSLIHQGANHRTPCQCVGVFPLGSLSGLTNCVLNQTLCHHINHLHACASDDLYIDGMKCLFFIVFHCVMAALWLCVCSQQQWLQICLLLQSVPWCQLDQLHTDGSAPQSWRG